MGVTVLRVEGGSYCDEMDSRRELRHSWRPPANPQASASVRSDCYHSSCWVLRLMLDFIDLDSQMRATLLYVQNRPSFQFGRKLRVTCPCLRQRSPGGLAHRLALGKVDTSRRHSSGKMFSSGHAAAMIDVQLTHKWRAMSVH